MIEGSGKSYRVSQGLLDATGATQKILSMDYLVKSPSKIGEKANYPWFWNVRWCVLVEMTCVISKLMFYYYEDKESYDDGEKPKGSIEMSDCTSIRSCYKSTAGFDHIFEIRCNNGKCIKFSASSCKKKFQWLDVLFEHKYDADTHGVVRSKVISQTRKMSVPETSHSFATDGKVLYRKPRSSTTLNETLSLERDAVLKSPRHDSGYSTSTFSSTSTDIEPPHLPPRRRRNSQGSLPSLAEDLQSLCSTFSDDLERARKESWDLLREGYFRPPRPCQRGPVSRGGSLKERSKPSLIDEYFFCEKCQIAEKGSSLKRRFSDKKKLALQNYQHSNLTENKQFRDKSTQSDQKGSSDYPDDTENEKERIYEVIDSEWLEKVRMLTSQGQDQSISNEDDEVDGSKNFTDDEFYMRMNLFTRENTPSFEFAEAILREDAIPQEDSKESLTSDGDVFEQRRNSIESIYTRVVRKDTFEKNSEIEENKTALAIEKKIDEICTDRTEDLKDDDSKNLSQSSDNSKSLGDIENSLQSLTFSTKLSSRNYGTLELSGFSEQYDTSL